MALGRMARSPSPPIPLSCCSAPAQTPSLPQLLGGCCRLWPCTRLDGDSGDSTAGTESCSSKRVRLDADPPQPCRDGGIRTGARSCSRPWYHPLLSAYTAPASPRAHPGAAGTIRHRACRPGGVSVPQRRRKKRDVCTGLASASAPQLPKKNPSSLASLVGAG